ncbi:FtsX-like permease family protein [Candidatus Falkowbacteria bacterium]|nr:FtsX-like permease family protein [Bacteroidales bacterium]NCU36404.1 FtsX-like permease family protein [Candidatus Falkowbacteria bacterium]
MKLSFRLAYRNLMGAGLRTWLNVGVLSFAFVVIIFYRGLIDGWNQQARRDSIAWEYGHGHLLHAGYDPADPFSVQDGHGILPRNQQQHLSPILLRQATVYPQGRMVPVVLKGIDVNQNTLALPVRMLSGSTADIPAMVGTRMAKSLQLKQGDELLLRWRDKNGTFDAANINIATIFDTDVSAVDNGQIWIPIEKLWTMTGLQGHATFFVASAGYQPHEIAGWNFKSQKEMLQSLDNIIQSKNIGGSIMYLLLLAIALLAIFDTQVLSIFRRQREIGTYISLGMTRWQVVGLFTTEGTMYSFLATIVGCIYGIPLFIFMANTGIAMPEATQDMGVSVAGTIYPVYGAGLIISTIVLVVISSTIVSFLPARKIARMDPVNALKGKLQ